MELGLGSYAFRWASGHSAFTPRHPLSLEEMVDATASAGCSLLQIADSPLLDALPSSGRRNLRAYAADRGVRLQCGSSGLTAQALKAQLDVATDLAADIVRFVIDGPGINPSDAEVIEALADVAPRYLDAGVIIAIENHFLTPSLDLRTIVESVDSPAVGVCLDTANSIMVGEWPETTVEILSPLAACLHLKDYAIESDDNGVGGHVRGRTLGTGWLDVGAVLQSVAAADERLGGTMGVIIEQWQPLGREEQETLSRERASREANVAAARRVLTERNLFGVSV